MTWTRRWPGQKNPALPSSTARSVNPGVCAGSMCVIRSAGWSIFCSMCDRQQLDAIYRNESRRVLATLIRLLGDFDQAEEALHDAFHAALQQWPRDGVPDNPRAWLVSTGRFKAIDRLRRRARFEADVTERTLMLADHGADPAAADDEGIEDDQLRLIFTCCHPALAPEAQLALTLRTVCGLTTEEIAR